MNDFNAIIDPLRDRGFVSRVSSMVSLPYRRTSERQIVRRNGELRVTFTATGDEMPYGKYPRLFDAYVATMVTSKDSSWNPETRTLRLGGTWRAFMRRLGLRVGGSQMRVIKQQMENWLKTVYVIDKPDATISGGLQYGVGQEWYIDWLEREPQEDTLDVFDNWIKFSDYFIDKVIYDHPVPVSLDVLASVGKSPMALDIYLWANRKASYTRQPVHVSWAQLYKQFGSDSRLAKFKENFRRAVERVCEAWPELKIIVSPDNGVTLFPSETTVSTVVQTKALERRKEHEAVDSVGASGRWFEIKGFGRVRWSSEAFDTAQAQNHLLGYVDSSSCPVCAYDQRNQELHGSASEEPRP